MRSSSAAWRRQENGDRGHARDDDPTSGQPLAAALLQPDVSRGLLWKRQQITTPSSTFALPRQNTSSSSQIFARTHLLRSANYRARADRSSRARQPAARINLMHLTAAIANLGRANHCAEQRAWPNYILSTLGPKERSDSLRSGVDPKAPNALEHEASKPYSLSLLIGAAPRGPSNPRPERRPLHILQHAKGHMNKHTTQLQGTFDV
ncbi:hypothetical protein CERZMDRAFT_96976 [Cercospora zeae-maydis SCOH1-5]|uniref:Uncharacterized protein n=1 Tax=Cercospora zeae-maydis SCOH1-5 TaxID=717836 RepID=A0A6A6FIS6_9PEZI|nr:hypothetical protein CERZMDRAFT_96976 [Cercospora zeae-maydis SCOH1-5]